MPEFSSMPDGPSAELVHEMRSLSSLLKAKSERKPRFPYLCKNGASCPFLACRSCWFVHDGDGVEVKHNDANRVGIATNNQKQVSQTQDINMRLTNMRQVLENKLVDLSKSLDHRFAELESRLDALADSVLSNESDMQDILCKRDAVAPSVTPTLSMEVIKLEVAKDVSTMFQDGLGKSFDAFGKLMENRFSVIEAKLGLTVPEASEPRSEPRATGG